MQYSAISCLSQFYGLSANYLFYVGKVVVMPKSVPELSDAVVRKLGHCGAKAAVYAVGGVSGLLLVCKSPARMPQHVV